MKINATNTWVANAIGVAGYVAVPVANKVWKTNGIGQPAWRDDTDTNTDTNTWQQNTKTQEGYVPAPGAISNKVWKTDAGGAPGWRDDADTNTTYGAGTNVAISASNVISSTDTNTTYSAGTGLDLSGTTFSVESDLRGEVNKIGHSSTTYTNMSASTSTQWVFGNLVQMILESDGDLFADGDITAFSTSTNSDRKLKTNIVTVENALDKVCQLDGVTFNWIKDGKESAGVIAQNVEDVLPRAVKEVKELNSDDTHKTVDYNQLSALFIEAIQALKEENKQLRSMVEELKDINS